MHSIWFLPAIVLAVLTYCVWRTQQSERFQKSGPGPSIPEPSTDVVNLPEPEVKPGRMMRWISFGEFASVRRNCSDLIVIDLRSEAKSARFPLSGSNVLPVTGNELIQVLKCLPPDKSVAFCGASNLSIFLIATSPCMEGSAPLYVLEGDLRNAEVA